MGASDSDAACVDGASTPLPGHRTGEGPDGARGADKEVILSASQLKNWRLCPRRWGYEKLARLPVKQSKAAALGERIHGVLEAMLKKQSLDDLPRDLVRRLEPAMMHMPYGDECIAEERPGFLVNIGGVKFTGRKDVQSLDRSCIWDLKTTRDFKWMKTPKDLQKDEQAIIYAHDAFVNHGVGEVFCNWVYVLSEGKPQVRVSQACFEPEDTQYTLAIGEIGADAREMRDHRVANTNPDTLPQRVESCRAFGGCPFLGRCFGSPVKQMLALSGNSAIHKETDDNPAQKQEDRKMGFKDKMQKHKELKQDVQQKVEAVGVTPPDAPSDAEVIAASLPKTEDTAAKGTEPGVSVLYVDCLPVKGERPVGLSELLAPVLAELATAHGDYRLMEYGKGKGALLALFKERYAGKLTTTIAARSRYDEHSAVLDWLESQATVVIRGAL